MPRITLLASSRRAGRVLLELDGDPWGSLPETVVVSHALEVGLDLDEAEVEALGSEAARADALTTALHCLAYRPRSRTELLRHLRNKGHAEQPSHAAIRRCEELGYIDDRAFALSFVRDRILLRPVGRSRIRSELRARGVSAGDMDAAIEEAFTEAGASELDLLRRAAVRRARALQSAERRGARRRLAGYLLRRGFPAADVRSIVDELLPETARP